MLTVAIWILVSLVSFTRSSTSQSHYLFPLKNPFEKQKENILFHTLNLMSTQNILFPSNYENFETGVSDRNKRSGIRTKQQVSIFGNFKDSIQNVEEILKIRLDDISFREKLKINERFFENGGGMVERNIAQEGRSNNMRNLINLQVSSKKIEQNPIILPSPDPHSSFHKPPSIPPAFPQPSPSLRFLLSSPPSAPQILWLASLTLSSLHFLIILFSFVSCRKLYGIQLLYPLQLTFYSLIPLNPADNTPLLQSLSALNFPPSQLSLLFSNYLEIPQSPSILPNYSSLSLHSNFFSNVNVLLLPLFLLPPLSPLLYYFGNRSTHYRTKPCCLKYSLSLLLQTPLALLLFNSFPLYTSFPIYLSSFSNNYNIPTLLLSILLLLLLPGMGVLFWKFQGKFEEFRGEFNDEDGRGCLGREGATRVRRMYPMVMMGEFLVAPVVLSVQGLFGVGLYVVLGLEVGVTVAVVVCPLYLLPKWNLRNLLHRFVVLALLVTLVVALNLPGFRSSLVLPLLLLSFLALSLLLTGSYTLYSSLLFWRSPSPIDDQLRIQQANLLTKTIELTPRSTSWIPRNEFTHSARSDRINTGRQEERMVVENYLTPSQKIQMWFEEIRREGMEEELGVDRGEFRRFYEGRPGWFEKERFVRRVLGGVDVDHVLYSFSESVRTLRECLDYFGAREVRLMREKNQAARRK